jgi:arylsulfatase A-like enzyme
MPSSRPDSSRAVFLAGVLLVLAAACSADAREASLVFRDLLTLGPDRIGAGEEDPRAFASGPVTLGDGESAVFHLQIRPGARLDVALEGGAGRLSFDQGVFAPALGQRVELAPMGSVAVTPGRTSAEEIDLPDPTGGVLVLRLTWEGRSAADTVRVTRLRLGEADPPPAPPTIFISVDTFSARHMSLYGYERETTPRMDAFAADAVTFTSAFANGTWTTPSYASQFSGVYPTSLRVDPNNWEWAIPRDRWTLAEMFRARGYRTAAFVDNVNVGKRNGIAQGFEIYDTSAAQRTITDTEGGIRHMLPLAERWMAEHRSEPFFLFLQVVDLHAPYVSPEEFEGAFDPTDGVYDPNATLPIEAPSGASHPRVDGSVPQYVAKQARFALATPGEMYSAKLVTAYDDQIIALDTALGGFFDRLRRTGIHDEAAILISADHGETMLEHDVYFRHVHNYQENLHVPLILRLPGGASSGRVVDAPVQLVDLYPTLAELAGLDPRAFAIHGRSLLEHLDGDTGEPIPILGDTGVGNANSVYWKGWKLIESYPGTIDTVRRLSHHLTRRWLAETYPEIGDLVIGTIGWREAGNSIENAEEMTQHAIRHSRSRDPYYELFDLNTDPGETTNLADEHPEIVESLLRVMKRLRNRGRLGRIVVPRDAEAPAELTAAERDELGKLGYGGEETEKE